MAIQVIPDNGSFTFFVRSNVDSNQTAKPVQIIGWAIDDETLQAKPIVFPVLVPGETLLFKSSSSNLQEIS